MGEKEILISYILKNIDSSYKILTLTPCSRCQIKFFKKGFEFILSNN